MSLGRAGNSAIIHHPSEATLLDYTVRALGPATRIVLEAHLAHCPECQAKVNTAEEIGGLLLDRLPPALLSPDALGRAMSNLDEIAECGTPPDASCPAESPPMLRELLRVTRLRWIAPGVRHALLLREGGAAGGALSLLRVKPGRALPDHDHRAMELTLVLEGAFADEMGRYGPGDLAEVDAGASHRPVAEGATDCLCLLATQGRLGFRSPLARLFGALRGV